MDYGTYSSAVKEKAFIRREICAQLRSGHIAILPLEDIKHPLPQEEINSRTIYYLSWI